MPRPFDGQVLSSLFCLMNPAKCQLWPHRFNSYKSNEATYLARTLEVETYIPLSEIAKNRFFVMIDERSIFELQR